MKKYNFKLHFKISLLVTIIVYLWIAFTYWDITVIMQIDNIDPVHRGFMVLFFICKHGLVWMYVDGKPLIKP